MVSHRIFSVWSLVVIAAAMLAAPPVAVAEVVFGNLGPAGNNSLDDANNSLVSTTNWRAHGFTVSGSNNVVQSVTLGLENASEVTARVQLFANSGNAPTGLALATSTNLVTTNFASLYTFNFPNTFLDVGSSYWAVVSAVNGTDQFSWSYNSAGVSPTQQNTSGYAFLGTITSSDGGTSWGSPTTTPGNFNTLPAISISAVPEPATSALAAVGLGLAVFLRSRRRKAAA